MAYEKDKHFKRNLGGPEMRSMWDAMAHVISIDPKDLREPIVEQPSQWHTVIRFHNGRPVKHETRDDRPTIAEQLKQEYFFAPVEEY